MPRIYFREAHVFLIRVWPLFHQLCHISDGQPIQAVNDKYSGENDTNDFLFYCIFASYYRTGASDAGQVCANDGIRGAGPQLGAARKFYNGRNVESDGDDGDESAALTAVRNVQQVEAACASGISSADPYSIYYICFISIRVLYLFLVNRRCHRLPISD
jgi:hypothetical protein